METLIVRPDSPEKLKALKVIMKTLIIDFETKKEKQSSYNPAFVAKIKKGEKQFKDGNYTTISLDDVWK